MIFLPQFPSHAIVRRCNARCARAVLAVALLGAATGFGHAQTAPDNPFAPLATTLRQRTDTPEAQDFVRKSRPAGEQGFVPVGSPRPEPGGKALTREQIMAMEAELEAARVRQDQIAGRRQTGKPTRTAAGDPYSGGKKKKQPAKCLLTCEIK